MDFRGSDAVRPEVGSGGEARVDGAADQRDVEARDRDELADRRDESGEQRDRSGEQRDTSGEHRDQVLDLLDQQADLADSVAGRRYRVASRRARHYSGGRVDPQLARQAAADREACRLDRERAGMDRRAGAAERVEAQLDRTRASIDRTAALDDRSQSGLDRSAALINRRNAAVDRGIATFDDLTGVYRRGPGLVELEREIARSTRTGEALVVLFVDVDGLKTVNDSLGHEAGDALIVAVADELAACFRPYDMIVRFGGDEFVCFCQDLTVTDADARIARVDVELARRGQSISTGLATLQPHDTAATIIARADQALYRRRDKRRPLTGQHDTTAPTDQPSEI